MTGLDYPAHTQIVATSRNMTPRSGPVSTQLTHLAQPAWPLVPPLSTSEPRFVYRGPLDTTDTRESVHLRGVFGACRGYGLSGEDTCRFQVRKLTSEDEVAMMQ